MRSTRKWEHRSMADLTCKWEHQNFICRNFSSQRICISNSTALTVTQLKILISLKNSGCMRPVVLMSMCVYVCLCVSALITGGMIWCDIGLVWLVKPILQLFSLLPSINWMGMALVTQHLMHIRQRWQNCCCTSHGRCINYLAIATRCSTLVIKVILTLGRFNGKTSSLLLPTTQTHLWSESVVRWKVGLVIIPSSWLRRKDHFIISVSIILIYVPSITSCAT